MKNELAGVVQLAVTCILPILVRLVPTILYSWDKLPGMAEGQESNRKLALKLVHRLIDLETERDSIAWILQFVKDPQTQQPLDWRELVRSESSAREAVRDSVLERYAHVRESLVAAKPECPDALRLLLSVSVDRVWEKP